MSIADEPSGVAGVLAVVSPGLGVRDGELVVTSCLNGDTRMLASRQVNARALTAATTKHGVLWTVHMDLDSASTRPPVTLRRHDAWVTPKSLAKAGESVIDMAINWASAQPNLQVQYVRDEKMAKVGTVHDLQFRAKGDLDGSNVRNLLATPGVVNVWITATGFRIWLARESITIGSLYHLSATQALAPHARIRVAGKAPRRKRTRRRK